MRCDEELAGVSMLSNSLCISGGVGNQSRVKCINAHIPIAIDNEIRNEILEIVNLFSETKVN